MNDPSLLHIMSNISKDLLRHWVACVCYRKVSHELQNARGRHCVLCLDAWCSYGLLWRYLLCYLSCHQC